MQCVQFWSFPPHDILQLKPSPLTSKAQHDATAADAAQATGTPSLATISSASCCDAVNRMKRRAVLKITLKGCMRGPCDSNFGNRNLVFPCYQLEILEKKRNYLKIRRNSFGGSSREREIEKERER
jgi:hypothetical protein